MKLLHVVPTYLPATRYGGPIYAVHSLCAALSRRGHEVHAFTTNIDGPKTSAVPVDTEIELDGVRVRYFETSFGRRLYRSTSMYKVLKDVINQFDVVHLHSVFLWPTTAAARLAVSANVPYVLSPRGMLVPDLIRRKSTIAKWTWIQLFEKTNLSRAAAVHVTSQIEEDEIAKLGLYARRFTLVPNGIDIPSELRSARIVTRGKPITILALGRVNWKKGLDKLIAAVAQVPDVRLLIAGNDEDHYQIGLESLTRSWGISDRVEFLGPIFGEEKWRLISSVDILALPSVSENFGNVVLEAMVCGIPVLVTPGVGLASTVESSGCGLVTTGDPTSIAEGLHRLVSSPAERFRMGEAGRRAAIEKFTWDAVAAQMEQEYAFIQSDEAPISGANPQNSAYARLNKGR